MTLVARADPRAWTLDRAHVGPFRELGDLKRTYSAGRRGSIATRLFEDGWVALASGAPVAEVTASICARALAAARLGDLDLPKLRELGLSEAEAVGVLERGFDELAGEFDESLVAWLRGALGSDFPADAPRLPFVALLAEQPRAGVTCPGRARLMLQPAENHAEHSVVVAIYAALVAPAFGADPVRAFFAGMVHHLHSAAMPDSGFTGEMLLEPHLSSVIDAAREQALAQLSPALQDAARAALLDIANDRSAEAQAFHTGDVIDRVLEIEQHLRSGTATMDSVLHEFELVHDGPVKPFHDRMLRQVGLL